MKAHEQTVFRFGAFVLVPGERLLLRDGKPLPLTGKAFDLLVALVRHAGHLLTKDELLRIVWPGVVVEEVNLSVNVSALRKALGAAPNDEWIQTVPRQGYRFNAAVVASDVATAPQLAPLQEFPGAPGEAGWLGRAGASPYPSVAVLPFAVDGVEGAYLADGLVEGVINGLTRIENLRVSPRASAFRLKDATADPATAGRVLDAAAVVAGSLTRSGDAVRLRLELIDVARETRTWNSAYELASADLPRLERRVVDDLARVLTRSDDSVRAREPTGDAQAYQAYLQGRYLWNQRSESSLQAAIVQFRRAVELDPGFALALAALADAHTTLGYLGYVAPAGTFPVARPYAMKALELDPSLAQAHASLGYIKFYFDWDWNGARQEFVRAIELNPNDPTSHQWYAVYLLASGQPERAFAEVQIAHRLDPLSLAINTDVGFHHYYNGRYAQAVLQLRSVLEMKSDFLLARLWLARTLLEMGQFDAALAETAIAEAKVRNWSVLLAARGFTYGVAGKATEARAVLREMDALSRQRFVTSYGVALVHAGLGRADEAFQWLGRAFDERSHWLVWLRLDPRWKSLHHDPRFPALVAKMNFPTQG
jgi:DNA-binding winged helix-turn-helix (wHTH) protein/TolB-like protein